MILLFLLILPFLVQAGIRDHHDCLFAKLRLLCGAEDYSGPLNVAIWDDNLFVLGGDKKIVSRGHFVTKGKPIIVRDARDTTDCWFYEPYIIFTSLCKNPSSTAVDPITLERFNSRFRTNEPIYSACRNIPSERAPMNIAEMPETVIQLADEDVDCKNQ